MESNMYDGTVHPEIWLNKIKYNCYHNNITTDENILNCCKTLIHPSINNVAEAKSFVELINALKSHVSFESFKNSVKSKLKKLKFDIENENNEDEILNFLNNFQQYCYEAEIKEFEEQKKLFLNTLSIYSIHYKFICDNLEKINSMKELIKYFNQSLSILEIKYGSCIALKHAATGKYLSSCDVNYQTGSEGAVVFAGQDFLVPGAIWIISKNDYLPSKHQEESVSYGKSFYLFHKDTYEMLDIKKAYKSPATKHAEVTICSDGNRLKAVNDDSNNCYILSNDIIAFKNSKNYILRSHEFTFTINDQTYQEVVGHNGRIGGNDKWCIELIEDIEDEDDEEEEDDDDE